MASSRGLPGGAGQAREIADGDGRRGWPPPPANEAVWTSSARSRTGARGDPWPPASAASSAAGWCRRREARRARRRRSEEHTSELQSLMRISYAVFCLKKKNIKE